MAFGWWTEFFAVARTELRKITTQANGAVTVFAGAATTLPKMSTAATGWMNPDGVAATSLPKMSTQAGGTETISGPAATTLGKLVTQAIGAVGNVDGAAATTLPKMATQGNGSEIFTGAAATALPKLSTAAVGSVLVFTEVVQVYAPGQLAAVTAAAFPTNWAAAGTGVWVKEIGAGGKGLPNAGGNSGNVNGGAGGAGIDEVFIPKATILAAGSAFNAKYGLGGNDGNTNRHSEFSVGASLLLRAGGAVNDTPGTCTVTGVTISTAHDGAAPGVASTGFYGAGGGYGAGSGFFGGAQGGTGGNSPTRSGTVGGAPPSSPTAAALLEAGAGAGGGNALATDQANVGYPGAVGGFPGGGGGGGGSGWNSGSPGGNGGNGGLRLRWV